MAQCNVVTPSLADFQCQICLEILVEPVTLPCRHTLCKPCFQASVEKASLRCPFCRAWISSWARHHRRRGALVNAQLWEEIQTHYPRECRDRLAGHVSADWAAGGAGGSQPVHVISAPGELRREYEQEVRKMEAELRARQEEESRASLDYIHKLLAREREEAAARGDQLRRDMRQKLRQPRPGGAASTSEEHSRKVGPEAKKHKTKVKHVEKPPEEALSPSLLLEPSPRPPPPGPEGQAASTREPNSPPQTPDLHPELQKPRPQPPGAGAPAGPAPWRPQGQSQDAPNALRKQLRVLLTRLEPRVLGSGLEATVRPGKEGSGPATPARAPKAASATAERQCDPH